MAEVLLRRHLDLAGVEATVSSAGYHQGGAPATGHGIEAMARRGLDLSGHLSRRVDREMLEQADLVIGMAREHVREAAVLQPGALAKAYTLKELVLLGEGHTPRARDEGLDAWLARVGRGRRRETLLGAGHDDELDVEDPVGRDRRDYEETADLLDRLLGRVVRLAFPTTSELRSS
jgi:protein-tyrosine phosphatase